MEAKMTIHTKYATYIFQAAFNNQDIECYLCTKTHDRLLENGGKGENSMEKGKPYECLCVRVKAEKANLYLSDRVVTTSPILAMLGVPQGRS